MLRHVGETSATIWVETSSATTVSILGRSARTFPVRGHHYALVVIEDLEPGSTTEYDVRLDGQLVWPDPGTGFPPSIIRTVGSGDEIRILAGSCRAAAPHEEPYTLELALDSRGRGVDTMWAHAKRMTKQSPSEWPTLLVLAGDQIYADDSSPDTEQRIERFRDDDCDLPTNVVANFEEYCWLYHEAWSPPLERWMLSVVPSLMIFDDHDMIDDWNISDTWVTMTRQEDWWHEHAIGGLMSYWIYQHLGNQSPEEIRADGILESLTGPTDTSDGLERWAENVDRQTPDDGGYRFSYARTIGDVKIVVIDDRNGRILEPGRRRMVADSEWSWVREQVLDCPRHVMLVTTLPVFIADGLHDLQVWSERVCDGAWGRWFVPYGEKARRALDLEDWSAFGVSYTMFTELLEELVADADSPSSIVVMSGDIHFSYSAEVPIGGGGHRVHQIVSSPIRNALIPHERSIMRFTLTRAGKRIGALLRRMAGAGRTAPGIAVTAGPYFANNMVQVLYRGDDVEAVFEHSTASDDGDSDLDEVARVML
jgi:hypothetical protein